MIVIILQGISMALYYSYTNNTQLTFYLFRAMFKCSLQTQA